MNTHPKIRLSTENKKIINNAKNMYVKKHISATGTLPPRNINGFLPPINETGEPGSFAFIMPNKIIKTRSNNFRNKSENTISKYSPTEATQRLTRQVGKRNIYNKSNKSNNSNKSTVPQRRVVYTRRANRNQKRSKVVWSRPEEVP